MNRTLLVLAIVSLSGLGAASATGCGSSSKGGGTNNTTDSGTAITDSGKTVADGGTTDTGTPSGDADLCPGSFDAATYAASACGKPGDMGNSLGIGAFCPTPGACSCYPNAQICSSLGNGMGMGPETFFCTNLCTIPDGGGDAGCGQNATCTCGSGGECACTPNTCLAQGASDGGAEN